MWLLIIFCFAVGELALMQIIGFEFGLSYYPPPSKIVLLGIYLITRSFVSVAIATGYYRKPGGRG